MGTEATFGLAKIRQIALVTRDLKAATQFYREALGMKLLFEVPGQLAFFDCNGIWLMLSLPEKDFDQAGSVLYFEVDDIQTAHQTLVQRGVSFIGEPHKIADMGSYDLWMAFFRDLDRNPLALRSEVKK